MNKRERKDMPWIIAAFGLVVFGESFPVSSSAGVRTRRRRGNDCPRPPRHGNTAWSIYCQAGPVARNRTTL